MQYLKSKGELNLKTEHTKTGSAPEIELPPKKTGFRRREKWAGEPQIPPESAEDRPFAGRWCAESGITATVGTV